MHARPLSTDAYPRRTNPHQRMLNAAHVSLPVRSHSQSLTRLSLPSHTPEEAKAEQLRHVPLVLPFGPVAMGPVTMGHLLSAASASGGGVAGGAGTVGGCSARAGGGGRGGGGGGGGHRDVEASPQILKSQCGFVG